MMYRPTFLMVTVCLSVSLIASMVSATEYPPSASGRMVMRFDLSHRSEPGETRLWIPYPVSDARQLITNVRVEGDYAELNRPGFSGDPIS